MVMEAFILGSGGTMPLPGRYLTSVLLRREGELFLFDCGEGTQVSLRSLNLKWKKITAIFISHTHADHVTGLPGILMLSSQVQREEPLHIIGPPKISEYVELSRKVLDMYINYEIVVHEIKTAEAFDPVYRGEGYSVRAVRGRHSKVCLGYVFEEDKRPGIFFPEKAEAAGVPKGPLWSLLQSGETVESSGGNTVRPEEVMGAPRRGRKFSFITDSLPVDGMSAEVADSDLFICEGMFSSDLAENAHEKGHMTAAEAAVIAKNAGGIDRMGLIHYSPRYTNRELKVLLKEAQEIFPAAFLTKDKQHVNIAYKD